LLAYFYYSGLPQALLRNAAGACTILLYHGVQPQLSGYHDNFIELAAFERQMEFLKKNLKVITLEAAVAQLKAGRPFTGRSAVITFDDGYRNVLTRAYPALKRLGLPFTVFLTTDFIGGSKRPWWDRLSEMLAGSVSSGDRQKLFLAARTKLLELDPDDQEKYLSQLAQGLPAGIGPDEEQAFMSWDEVRSLAADPLVEIGSHTVSHPVTSRLAPDRLRAELTGSKKTIEGMIGRPVSALAYPYGFRSAYSDQVVAEVKKAGYTSALTGVPGRNTVNSDIYRLNRISVYTGAPWFTLVTQLSGIQEWLWGLRERLNIK
jgi:peptidoglycan/xylan/chitin deacetylase (PgdA/CDA1 family)